MDPATVSTRSSTVLQRRCKRNTKNMKAFESNADDHDFTTWQVVQEYMPRELLSEYRSTFNSFDPSKTGLIQMEDVTKILNKMGHIIAVNDVRKLLHDIVGMDCNEETIKYADFTEYVAIMSAVATNCVPEYEMLLVFREFDRDGDGYISPHELKDLLARLGDDISEKDLQEMMHEADRDGDGKVSYNEFVRVMTNSIESTDIASSDSSDFDDRTCVTAAERSTLEKIPRESKLTIRADGKYDIQCADFNDTAERENNEHLTELKFRRSKFASTLRRKVSSKMNSYDSGSDSSDCQKNAISNNVLNKLQRVGSKNDILRNAFKRKSKRMQKSD